MNLPFFLRQSGKLAVGLYGERIFCVLSSNETPCQLIDKKKRNYQFTEIHDNHVRFEQKDGEETYRAEVYFKGLLKPMDGSLIVRRNSSPPVDGEWETVEVASFKSVPA